MIYIAYYINKTQMKMRKQKVKKVTEGYKPFKFSKCGFADDNSGGIKDRTKQRQSMEGLY